MGLFGINYELEKGTSFGFGNVCGSSGSGGFPPAHCCLVYVFIQLSPLSPPHPCGLSLLVACAGNPNGMPTALEEEGGSKCKGRWPVGDGVGHREHGNGTGTVECFRNEIVAKKQPKLLLSPW